MSYRLTPRTEEGAPIQIFHNVYTTVSILNATRKNSNVFFPDERLLDNHRLNISTSLSNLIQGLHIAVDSKWI